MRILGKVIVWHERYTWLTWKTCYSSGRTLFLHCHVIVNRCFQMDTESQWKSLCSTHGVSGVRCSSLDKDVLLQYCGEEEENYVVNLWMIYGSVARWWLSMMSSSDVLEYLIDGVESCARNGISSMSAEVMCTFFVSLCQLWRRSCGICCTNEKLSQWRFHVIL